MLDHYATLFQSCAQIGELAQAAKRWNWILFAHGLISLIIPLCGTAGSNPAPATKSPSEWRQLSASMSCRTRLDGFTLASATTFRAGLSNTIPANHAGRKERGLGLYVGSLRDALPILRADWRIGSSGKKVELDFICSR